MNHYLWWPITVLIFYIFFGYVSHRSNIEDGYLWAIILWIMTTLMPLWLIVSKISRNLVFDGLLYDVLILVGYQIAMLYLGHMKNMSMIQIIGIIITIIGFILIRIE